MNDSGTACSKLRYDPVGVECPYEPGYFFFNHQKRLTMEQKMEKSEVVLKVGHRVKLEIDGHAELYEVQASGLWAGHAIRFPRVFVELHSVSKPVKVVRLSSLPESELYG